MAKLSMRKKEIGYLVKILHSYEIEMTTIDNLEEDKM
ncbi:hypothetical protein J2Z66_000208 [Paenibacillus eucommiae]|uniref:Uncharacterized protein n=1 Tax=Paenibacillus eucommiae TaxID=1355755 RepID=A0ABS4IM12_9BACL|nr:hypothetical protein [Paenibacillus eucommiae]